MHIQTREGIVAPDSGAANDLMYLPEHLPKKIVDDYRLVNFVRQPR